MRDRRFRTDRSPLRRRATALLATAALVGTSLLGLAPATAGVVTLTDSDALVFNRANGVTNIVGSGTAANDIVLYKNVGTFGGQVIDAAITTVSVVGSISNYDNPGSASTATGYQNNFQLNTVGGAATLQFAFYEAGSYTGPGSGIPVTLQNVKVTSIDLDSSGTGGYQYSDFSGFQKYSMMNPTNLAVQAVAASGTLPARVRFIATKTGARSSVPEDQVLIKYDAMRTMTVTFGNVVSGQTNYFGLVFGGWPGTGTPVEYTNSYNNPPTSTSSAMYVADSATATTVPLSSFGAFSDADGNPFTQVKITQVESAGDLEWFNGTAWVDVTANQVITTSDIERGNLRFTATGMAAAAAATLQFLVHDGLDYSVSPNTLTLTVAGQGQTITFANPGLRAPGAQFAANATASSQLPVTLTSSTTGICTVNGDTITAVVAGTCVITATQPGDANYGAAAPVTQTFPVSTAQAQTITFSTPTTKTTADGTFASGATSSAGLPVTLASLTPAVCTTNGTNIVILGPGTCTIRASQAGDANTAPATPVEVSFLVQAGAPVAVTNAATSIVTTSATLNGSVNAFGGSATVQFCLGTTNTTYSAASACPAQNLVTGTPSSVSASTATPVSYAATGLTQGTTYYFQVLAVGANGTAYGEVRSFTTAVPNAGPVATTLVPTAQTYSNSKWKITFAGSITATRSSTDAKYCYSSTAPTITGGVPKCSKTRTASPSTVSAGTTAISYARETTSTAGVTYYYWAIATTTNSSPAESGYGEVLKVVTGAPLTITNAASGLAAEGAILNGSVTGVTSSQSTSTQARFCYGTSSAATYGVLKTCTLTPFGNAWTGTSATAVSEAVTGLHPSTTYYFQVIAKNNNGTNYGQIRSFTTSAGRPTVKTLPANAVLSTSARINGTVNANRDAATVAFCYGTAANLSGCTAATATPGTASGSDEVGVQADLANLLPYTTYYYRVSATNTAGTADGAILSFTTGAPVAITSAAMDVTGTTATLNGAVQAHGDSANVSFCYGTLNAMAGSQLTTCTSAAATPATVTGAGTASVSANVSSLNPGDTYYFQTVASKTVGGNTYTAYGEVLSFVAANAPLAVTETATAVTSTSATLPGSVTANGAVTAVMFCFGTSAATTDGFLDSCTSVTAAQSPLAANSAAAAVSIELTGLAYATTYYFQVVGDNSRGTAAGEVKSFTTTAVAPTATTLAATVNATTATLNGTVAAGGADATVKFCFSSSSSTNNGVLSNCGAQTATPSSIVGRGTGAVSLNVSGLSSATTYYFQVFATNAIGTTYGAVLNFKAGAPATITNDASAVSTSAATLNGSVDPNGSAVSAISFCYSDTDPTLASCTTVAATPTTLLSTDTATAVSANLTGLAASTIYYFQTVATNGRGTSKGAILTFTTGAPSAVTLSPTSVTTTGATLRGSANANNGATATTAFCLSSAPDATDGVLDDCLATVDVGTATGASAVSMSATVTDLNPDGVYWYQAVADASGLTGYGQILSFSTGRANQTITFPNPGNKTYGDGPLTPAPTSSAGLVVTLVSSTPSVCTVTNGVVTIIADGTCTLTASQAGDATTSAATDVTRSFTVSKLAITVTATSLSKQVGANDPALVYTLSRTLVASDAVTGALTRATGETAGTYAITRGTLALPSAYNVTFVAGVLTITSNAPTYSITYSGNGATSGTAPADTNTYVTSDVVTVLGNTGSLARSGYTFLGWNTAANGSGTTYTAAQTFTVGNANVTLFALWSRNAVDTTPSTPVVKRVEKPTRTLPTKETKTDAKVVTVTTVSKTAVLPTPQAVTEVTVLPEIKTAVEKKVQLAPTADGIKVTPVDGFTGKLVVPVLAVINNEEVEVLTEIVVNPAPVPVAATTPKTTASAIIRWEKSTSQVVEYLVAVDGQQVCETAGTSCVVAATVGPKTVVQITAIGNDATVSEVTPAKYEALKLIAATKVNFAESSAKLDAAAKAKLQAVAKVIIKAGFTTVAIEGHTDSQGGQKNASTLSLARAKAAQKYLDSLLPARLEVKLAGKGLSVPVASNTTASGQAANRRAQVFVK